MDRVDNHLRGKTRVQTKDRVRGADVGGTWIRIAVWAEHRVATTIVPADRDLQQLASVLRALWRRRRWSRRRVAALVVASRGLWTPAERRILARAAADLAARVHVISDAQAALLGALGNSPCAAAVGHGIDRRRPQRAGRWARAGGPARSWAMKAPDSGSAASGSARARDGHLLPALRASRPRPGENDGRDGPRRPRAGPSRIAARGAS
jgi:hypothetical protein